MLLASLITIVYSQIKLWVHIENTLQVEYLQAEVYG